MSRILSLALLAALAGLSSGCAMCCAPFDCDYPSVPGRWVRHNPASGRVGSAFDEAGAQGDTTVISNTPAPTATVPQPPPQEPTSTSSPSDRTSPPERSVIPRNMGETYLPRG